MSIIRRSAHTEAEAHIAAAKQLLSQAADSVLSAAAANDKARDAHETAINYHADRLDDVSKRGLAIAELARTVGVNG